MSAMPSSRIVFAARVAVAASLACRPPAPGSDAQAVERTALVAQACPELALDAGPIDPTDSRVFVEVAEVSTRDLPIPIGRWLDENAVRIRASANLVAFPNVPTSTPWGQCVDAVCGSAQRSLTVTARLPEETSQPFQLTLGFDEKSADGQEPPHALLEATVAAKHQEPVVLPNADAVSAGSLVVTAYLLRRHDDLQRVMACKVRQAEKEKRLE